MSRILRFSVIMAVCVLGVSLSYWSVQIVYAGCSNLQGPGQCGHGGGQQATGEPIKIGAIVTNIPGHNLTWIGRMAEAYFACVNDNGGIQGRPIEFILEVAQTTDPKQIAALARKLIEVDGVLGFVGNTSISDCSVNQPFYAEQGFYPIIAGIDLACFTSPNLSAVNLGPYYSTLGAAQSAVRFGATGTLVVVAAKDPGFDLSVSGAVEFAETQGLKGVSLLVAVPIAKPAELAQKLVRMAGMGGGVVLQFTGPTVLPLLQAIEQQGLIDAVVWASTSPANDLSIAQQLSSAWNGKLLVNAEFNMLDANQPDQNHMNKVRAQYAPDVPLSGFAQRGYLASRIATDALLSIKGEITKESVNQAFRSVKNFASDLFCKPWYYDSTVGANVSNNTGRTVAPMNGSMVQVEDCFEIAALPSNPLAQIRVKEQELGLNMCTGR